MTTITEISDGSTIWILSAEGDYVTIHRHTGRPTVRAVRMALTRERCGGDRWARAYVMEAGEDTMCNIDDVGDVMDAPSTWGY